MTTCETTGTDEQTQRDEIYKKAFKDLVFKLDPKPLVSSSTYYTSNIDPLPYRQTDQYKIDQGLELVNFVFEDNYLRGTPIFYIDKIYACIGELRFDGCFEKDGIWYPKRLENREIILEDFFGLHRAQQEARLEKYRLEEIEQAKRLNEYNRWPNKILRLIHSVKNKLLNKIPNERNEQDQYENED